MPDRSLPLQSQRAGESYYSLTARLLENGSLTIEGLDRGEAPAAVWGRREYEWTITVAPADLPRLVGALGGDVASDDPLELLAARYAEDPRYGTRAFLEEAGIPCEFWSWIGD